MRRLHLIALVALCWWTSYTPVWAQERLNIVYIMLDDAGWGDFSTYGSTHIETPAMDRLAAEGTRFTDHYAGSAVCAPSRCVLMTGLHTGHCRRRDNVAKAHQDDFVDRRPLVFLEPEDVTVAEVLQAEGYVTAGIGKWGLGNPGFTGEPTRQGFDHWFGYLDQVHAHDHYTDWLWRDGERVPLPGNEGDGEQTYVHDLFEEATLDFVRENRDRPFFLYLAYTLPHGAYVIPHDDPAYARYADRPWPQQVRNYAAMVTRADRTVGRLLDLLAELDLAGNTVVFYTSDNGPNEDFAEVLDSNGPFRGIKRDLYEGGIRAPMVVRWPGHVPAGRTSDFVWDMRDFFPTAVALADAQIPDHVDGVSVLPALLGRSQPERDHLYWEYHSPFQQAVRKGQWKAIRFGTEEPVALYDLAVDPEEAHDVAGRHPDVARALARIMDTSRTPSRYWPARAHHQSSVD